MKEAVDHLVEKLDGLAPTVALVLGPAWAGWSTRSRMLVRIPYADLPGFPQSGVTAHAGRSSPGFRRAAGADAVGSSALL